MLKRVILAVACTYSLAFAVPVDAQHWTTLVLRSGERLTGELIDHRAVGFSMRINGQNRDIAASDVARLELSGNQLNANQQAEADAGRQFVLLNDGQVIDGRLYDIGGTSPLRITLDTSSGRRDFKSTEVAVISLASVNTGAVATSGVQAAPAGAVIVPGNRRWTPTNITVKAGDTLRFQTTGEIRFTNAANDRAHSAGSLEQRKPAGGAPLPANYVGALIARIDNGLPFAIGDQTAIQMPASGMLYLGINDDYVRDNSGQFQVVISR